MKITLSIAEHEQSAVSVASAIQGGCQ